MSTNNFAQITFAEQARPTYTIFDGEGNPVGIEKIIDALGQADVLFLGESHDDAIGHKLQAEIFRKVLEKYTAKRKIALSLEMFERDVQTTVDEYLTGLISETHFMSSARPWGNYKTDYRPLVELAKESKLPVIAANAPRRYINMVARSGRESLAALSPQAKAWIAPLPYAQASDAYRKKFTDLMGGMSDANHNMVKMVDSQSLWDATMAYSIAEELKKNKNSLIVHLNGSFHTENHLGLPEHLTKYQPKAKFLVVTMKYDENFTNFDKAKYSGLGDFVVLTDAKQPRSGK